MGLGPLDRGFRSPESTGIKDMEAGSQMVGRHVPSIPLASHSMERGTAGSASIGHGAQGRDPDCRSKDISALRISILGWQFFPLACKVSAEKFTDSL